MRVTGKLLTMEEREKVMAPLHKNEGKQWDLHEMSLYVEKGYKAIAADDKTSAMQVLQAAMRGEAAKAGIAAPADVVSIVSELRSGS